MSEEGARSQTEVFEKAKQSIAAELGEEMLRWDFSKMLEELQGAIKSVGAHDSKPTRFFARHYLNMIGERHKEVREWFSGQRQMSAEDITAVLTALKLLRGGSLATNAPEKPRVSAQSTSGLVRRIIDHTVGDLNSNVGLIVEAGITPEHAYESDRMQIQAAVQKICESFGVAVAFPESETTFGPSLTHEDLAEIGFDKTQRRKK